MTRTFTLIVCVLTVTAAFAGTAPLGGGGTTDMCPQGGCDPGDPGGSGPYPKTNPPKPSNPGSGIVPGSNGHFTASDGSIISEFVQGTNIRLTGTGRDGTQRVLVVSKIQVDVGTPYILTKLSLSESGQNTFTLAVHVGDEGLIHIRATSPRLDKTYSFHPIPSEYAGLTLASDFSYEIGRLGYFQVGIQRAATSVSSYWTQYVRARGLDPSTVATPEATSTFVKAVHQGSVNGTWGAAIALGTMLLSGPVGWGTAAGILAISYLGGMATGITSVYVDAADNDSFVPYTPGPDEQPNPDPPGTTITCYPPQDGFVPCECTGPNCVSEADPQPVDPCESDAVCVADMAGDSSGDDSGGSFADCTINYPGLSQPHLECINLSR